MTTRELTHYLIRYSIHCEQATQHDTSEQPEIVVRIANNVVTWVGMEKIEDAYDLPRYQDKQRYDFLIGFVAALTRAEMQ